MQEILYHSQLKVPGKLNTLTAEEEEERVSSEILRGMPTRFRTQTSTRLTGDAFTKRGLSGGGLIFIISGNALLASLPGGGEESD